MIRARAILAGTNFSAARKCDNSLNSFKSPSPVNPELASIILRGSPYDWYALPFVLAGGIAAGVSFYWRFFIQWLRGKRGGKWRTTSAVVDIVSVSEEYGSGGETIGYLCTLTYFYRNPELQSGEYCRSFPTDEKADAEAWAASYKGTSVPIHVDPRDPTRSILRKEDL